MTSTPEGLGRRELVGIGAVVGALLLSLLGDGVFALAIAWLVLERTGSPLALGVLVGLFATVRTALLPVGGLLVDRAGPRRSIIGASLSKALTVLALGAALGVAPGDWPLFVAAVALGVASAVQYPAELAVLPGLVARERLAPANAALQGGMNVVNFVAPALGGTSTALLGPAPSLVLVAALYGVAAGSISLGTSGPPAQRAERRGTPWDLVAAMRAFAIDPRLRPLLLAIGAVNLGLVGTIAVGLPALVHDAFALTADVLGVLTSAMAAGSIGGAAAAGALARRGRPALTAGLALFACAGALVLVGLTPNLTLALILLVVAGGGSGVANVVIVTLIQSWAPTEQLGRAMSFVLLVSFGAGAASQFLAGALAAAAGPRAVFVGAGGLAVLGAAAVLPTLTRLRHPVDE